MNWLHLHLMINHLPIVGFDVGLIILFAALLWKSSDLKRFSLIYFVIVGIGSIFVYLSGGWAEHAVDALPGFSKELIEKHEETSQWALVLIESVAVLSLMGLKMKRLFNEKKFFRALFILAFLGSVLLGYVANSGGRIRHTEIGAS